jgi:signal peptidase II
VPNDADSGAPRDETRTGSVPERRTRLAAGIVFTIVALDLLTKAWAVRDLADGPVSIIGDTVSFRLARNTGGAFSVFQAFTPVLAIVAGVVAFFLVRTVRRTRDTLLVVALSLVLGGAIGNLIDRIFRSPGFLRGAVVDFVHVGRWPTFNVSDSAITIGAILVVVWSVRSSARERHAGTSPGDTAGDTEGG